MEEYRLVPIGYVCSPVTSRREAPRQGRDSGGEAWIEILEPYAEGLRGIEDRPWVQVICWMHWSARDLLQLHPRGDPAAPVAGVFATRSPARPNPLAVYPARLLEVRGRFLRVSGLDAVDGTPVVDLKPHVGRLDE